MHDMEDLGPSACWAVLRTASVGRLAIHCGDDDVDVFPINYIVDHGTIVFRTASGTKFELIVAERKVTFEADDTDLSDGVVWSVVAKGPTEVIHARDDVIGSFDLDVHPFHAGSKPMFVRMTPERLTGRRFTMDPAVMKSMQENASPQ